MRHVDHRLFPELSQPWRRLDTGTIGHVADILSSCPATSRTRAAEQDGGSPGLTHWHGIPRQSHWRDDTRVTRPDTRLATGRNDPGGSPTRVVQLLKWDTTSSVESTGIAVRTVVGYGGAPV
jgi:hypothetical protein